MFTKNIPYNITLLQKNIYYKNNIYYGYYGKHISI